VSDPTTAHGPARAAYARALGDDALVMAQRCGEWIASAPELEEDLALANIGLDLLGQATSLLRYAAELEGGGRTEDDLAFLRDADEFANLWLCELDNGDFAVSMARLLVFSTYQLALYSRLCGSTDALFAGVAAKAVKEVAYHRDHATLWVVRLGDGTHTSHLRMQAGLDHVWPFVGEIFEEDWLPAALVELGVAVRPSELEGGVRSYLRHVVDEATLSTPSVAPAAGRGRHGVHTEALTVLLTTMQQVHRSHPGVLW
jgi:ring-1,2-phenylacetyl-CoA epoxidase subunit PaaC